MVPGGGRIDGPRARRTWAAPAERPPLGCPYWPESLARAWLVALPRRAALQAGPRSKVDGNAGERRVGAHPAVRLDGLPRPGVEPRSSAGEVHVALSHAERGDRGHQHV